MVNALPELRRLLSGLSVDPTGCTRRLGSFSSTARRSIVTYWSVTAWRSFRPAYAIVPRSTLASRTSRDNASGVDSFSLCTRWTT